MLFESWESKEESVKEKLDIILFCFFKSIMILAFLF